MAYMRSSLAFALFWVNFIVASLNIFFSIKIESVTYSKYKYEDDKSHIPPPYDPYNLYRYTLTKNETLLEKKSNYFIEKENKTQKKLRNLLDLRGQYKVGYLIKFINIIPFVFLIIFSFSFCVTKNECCSSDYDDGNAICFASCCVCCLCCCDCSLSNGGGFSLNFGGNNNAGGGLLFIIIFALIIYGIYKAVQACGKNISRLISAIGLFFANVALVVLGILSGTDKFNILLIAFSSFAVISNLLAMVLPNLACCHNLSYEHLYEDDDIIQVNSTPQQLLTVQPQNEIPLGEEAYPNAEEVIHAPIDQNITPNYNDTNPGYDNDNNRYSINSLDAPAPIYIQQGDEYNNQENGSYPKPQ